MFNLTPISLAIFVATLVNLFVAYSSWRRRTAKNGLYFAFAMSAATGWTLAAGLDYAAVPVALKVSFAKLEYLAYTSALACFTAFALSYAGYEAWLKKPWVKFLLIGLPAVTTLLAWTNDWHGLIWSGFTPNLQADNVLIFHHGPAFTLIALLGYGLIFTIFVSLLAAVLKGNVLARKQARLLLWALLALVASNLIYLFDIFNIPGVDWSSIAFSITGLLFLFALYGSRFMDIVPIARTTLIERMVDGVLVLDMRGNLVDFNPAAQTILGLNLSNLWTPWSQALARWPEICAALNRPIEPRALEIALGPTGVIFELSLSPLHDTRGEAYGLLIVMRDITQRKQAEASLRESEALYRQVFTSHSAVMLLVDPMSGAIVQANPAAAEFYGYPLETFQQMNLEQIIADMTPNEIAQRRLAVAAGDVDTFTAPHRLASGEVREVEVHSAPVHVEGRTLLYSIIHDVTERKRAAEAMLKMAAFEERQRLARDLHDSVNQSIHSLVLFAETLLVTLERQQIDRARHIATRMQESARQALKETRLLLYQTHSPLDKGENLIEDLEARLAMVERYAGLQAQLTLEGSLDYLPAEWSDNLFWIAVEALNNALKHAQAHSVHMTLCCLPGLIELDVIDDGCGFDPTQVRAGRLGLINLQRRAALIGGKLDVTSAPGQGCRIHFYAEVTPTP